MSDAGNMPFVLVGLNHRTAPVEVRERLTIAAADLPAALESFCEQTESQQAVLLSTCNRVEILGCEPCDQIRATDYLSRQSGLSSSELRDHLYFKRGEEAVQHVFRVAASLDSMVVGEAQILGQLKEAYAVARASGFVKSGLDALFAKAFAVAKRVRTETMVGSSSVSIASTAVELAKKIFGSLERRSVLLIGAGKMTELALRHLRTQGVGEIFVINRTFERAAALARKFDGKALAPESMSEAAPLADIVITSTGSAEPIIRKQHAEEFMQRRKNRPMFFIDIGVPRDVEPSVNEVDGVFVYDIDDLQHVVAANTSDRTREAERAEAIVLHEVGRFRERMRELHVVPTIVSLQDSMELMRQAEIDRMRSRLGPLTVEQEAAIESLTRGIINKVLHGPITALKTAAKAQEADALVEQAERLFGISQSPKSRAKV